MPNTKPLLGPCDSYQLEPFQYPWAWEMNKIGRKNTWFPEEIGMAQDVQLWKANHLLEEERHLFLAVMAQLTTFDIQRGDDAGESLMSVMEPGEIKHYLKRLIFEEAVHTESYRVIIDNMGLDLEIYSRWKTVPAMKARIDIGNQISDSVREIIARRWLAAEEKPYTTEEKQVILFAMVFWFLMFEGVWFAMSLLGPIQSLARNGKFKAAAQQFQYIARDELGCHVPFGTMLIKEFIAQYPEAWTSELKEAVVTLTHRCIDLERDYIHYCLPTPILGYNANDHMSTAEYYADLRLKSIGLPEVFGSKHMFPWFDEMTITNKESNFFEQRVTEYQVGGALDWDDNELDWDDNE